MADVSLIGSGQYISPDTCFGDGLIVGHATCVGAGRNSTPGTTLGARVRLGAFCVVSRGATIADDVEVDHYCRLGDHSRIGSRSKILYGVQLFNNCSVGENCIIGGNLSERVVVEDYVTFMGRLAHSHRNPNLDWDTTDEPSSTIHYGSVVGVDALLIGALSVGPFSYIASGEVVRHSIPPRSVFYKGEITPLDRWKGVIRVRDAHLTDRGEPGFHHSDGPNLL